MNHNRNNTGFFQDKRYIFYC